MAIDQTFAPAYGRGATASVTSSSASTELGFRSKTICLTNTGDKVCYVRIGIPGCLLYTSPSPRDRQKSRMPSSA